ncbi:MAG: hypothetical protein ACYC9Z_11320 [Casimicrobiaceae bacterium]
MKAAIDRELASVWKPIAVRVARSTRHLLKPDHGSVADSPS